MSLERRGCSLSLMLTFSTFGERLFIDPFRVRLNVMMMIQPFSLAGSTKERLLLS